MKRTVWMVVATAFLAGVTLASAQSLGDVARANRKAKGQPSSTTKHFDNDNLPRNQQLSVVGPAPSTDANTNSSASADNSSGDANDANNNEQPAKKDAAETPNSESKAPGSEAKAPAAGKDNDSAMKARIDGQKQKIETLSKDLELSEREYRLRAVEMYSDVGNRLRNAEQWDKDEAQYKKEIADKQAALDAAKQELTKLEEEERTGDSLSDKSNPIR